MFANTSLLTLLSAALATATAIPAPAAAASNWSIFFGGASCVDLNSSPTAQSPCGPPSTTTPTCAASPYLTSADGTFDCFYGTLPVFGDWRSTWTNIKVTGSGVQVAVFDNFECSGKPIATVGPDGECKKLGKTFKAMTIRAI